jgi:hypothetical protein
MQQSVFHEEWRKCLQEHYKDVIKRNDQVTLKSLVPVLHRVGFREEDLRALYLEATLRTEDLPDGFIPNLALTPVADEVTTTPLIEDDKTFTPHPAECSCPSCMDKVDLLRHDKEGQPLNKDKIAENVEREETPKKKSRTKK